MCCLLLKTSDRFTAFVMRVLSLVGVYILLGDALIVLQWRSADQLRDTS
jgi:hypothetical protein